MDDQIHFRPPTSGDAGAMRALARDSGVLSVNSTYYYALMARHFSSTCLVAEDQGRLCAYAIGYGPPAQPGTLFIWQVGVAAPQQGRGLAKKMVSALIHRCRPDFLEATIAPANQASIALFRAVARQFSCSHTFSEAAFFSRQELGGDQAEHLMRIGPFAHLQTA
jgi:diaminobutyrate acetyltransferase